MANAKIRYFVFDIESVADGTIVSKIRYPSETLSPKKAIRRYRDELIEKYDTDFIPYTFQVPVSIVVAKVTEGFVIDDIVALDEPDFRSHVMTKMFWEGWEKYKSPTLVSFNGRSFDVPLLELSAYRYGLSVPKWFAMGSKSWDQPRNRYNLQRHLDLQDVLVNHGAVRFNGGLNLAANLLGKPGKMDVQGYMVQDMYDDGKLAEINNYCRCDVLDTYFVFLRTQVMVGKLSLEDEQEIVGQTKNWLIERSNDFPVYKEYVDQWGEWPNPWLEVETSAT